MTNKLFFLGTPSFSANILEGLIKNQIQISGVITGADKKQGRGYKLAPSEVAKVSETHKIPLFKPTNIHQLSEILQNESPDLCLVIAFGMIFPEQLVKTYNFINIHTSLLPKYRGPSPIQACLLSGDTKTGVSLMKIGKGIDDGDVIATQEIAVSETETADSLFKKLENISINLLGKQLPLKESWNYLPQDNSKATYTKKIKKEDGYIDFQKEPASIIYNKYRAFYPWPGIYTYQNNQRIKITSLKKADNKLEILEVQKEGKKPIPYKDYLNSNPPIF